MEPTLSCQHLHKSFGETVVLRDLSFSVAQGQILALLGPSGCGKTTTLRLIAGFERVDGGSIEIAGRLVVDGRHHMPPEKRRVGMVFQDYAIFPHLGVSQNISFGLGRGREAAARTEEILRFVGLGDQGDRMPHELSGGQQQRVALARALAPEPAVLLLDEPFSNLDANLRGEVRREVRDLLKQSGTTAIFVTHDQEEALYLGDRVGILNEGRLEQMGTPEQIFHRPQTRFVAEFMGQTDFLAGQVVEGSVITAMGRLAPPPPQSLLLSDGTGVTLAIRSDDVELCPDDAGNGRLTDCQFLGIARLYEVTLSGGSRIHSWQPHTVVLPLGASVRASFRPAHPITCFDGDRAIATLVSA